MNAILPELPDHASVRIFHADRPLTADDVAQIAAVMNPFIAQWTSHKAEVCARYAVVAARFLVVAVDERKAALTGCSKDSLVRTVRAVEAALRCAMISAPPVAYRDGGTIRTVARDVFAEAAKAGTVTPETIVFDETVQTLGDVRAGRFETAAKNAWHARAFDFAVRA